LPQELKPILCYVTDRRVWARIPSAAAEPPLSSVQVLRTAVQRAAAAGVQWIQIREKDLAGSLLAEVVRQAVQDTKDTGAKIIVNDRLDVATACGAAGVHLGETSLPVEAVAEWRKSSGKKDFLIGVSCHLLEAARSAERGGADYIHFGPVFATPSKLKFGQPQGLEKLREVCAAVRIPVLAIGGVTFENARECLAAGAAGFAAIRLFQEPVTPTPRPGS
jgi:thiamine-phosphate pyrophosphorylase